MQKNKKQKQKTNKCDHKVVVIVVLDNRYDESNKFCVYVWPQYSFKWYKNTRMYNVLRSVTSLHKAKILPY